jgi:hypothetical protein
MYIWEDIEEGKERGGVKPCTEGERDIRTCVGLISVLQFYLQIKTQKMNDPAD